MSCINGLSHYYWDAEKIHQVPKYKMSGRELKDYQVWEEAQADESKHKLIRNRKRKLVERSEESWVLGFTGRKLIQRRKQKIVETLASIAVRSLVSSTGEGLT